MATRYTGYLTRASLRPDAVFDAAAYPFNIAAVRSVADIEFHPRVTFFVGENGSGKSTVLEALAVALGHDAQGGTRNVQTGAAPSVSPLHEALRLARGLAKPQDSYFLRAETFFNLATYMDEVGYLDAYGGKSLHARSHGEAFMALLLHKLRGKGLYLLDEPEAALSPNRQLAALARIHQLAQNDSQFVIATHSPLLLAYPHARIVRFDADGVATVPFEQTEPFVVTRDFLNNHKERMQRLLQGDAAQAELI